ncbi:MAG: sulfatase-like hydrolase/transferase [Jejuia sp.]
MKNLVYFIVIFYNITAFAQTNLILNGDFENNLSSPNSNTKPNVIFIFADDLGWGDLSCYGGDRIKTKSLDRLATEGTLFTQFYVPGSVCSPSRVGIMTGQYPSRNRIYGHFSKTKNDERQMPNALDTNITTLTDILSSNGYITAHFGKWHMGNVSPKEYGVDVFSTNEFSNLDDGEKLLGFHAVNRPTCTKDVFDKTLEFIEKNKDKPFYINAWLFDVHATLRPSKEQLDAVSKFKPFDDPDIENSESINFFGVEQVYLAALKNMDNEIGIFLDKLNQMGLSENTLIIFSSDNGPEDYQIRNSAHSGVGSAGPFRGRKRSLYEGGIRVPFILKWPNKIPSGTVNSESIINGVDFIPTITDILGFSLPENIQALDGENLSDVWLGSPKKRMKPLFWEWRYNIFGHVLNKSPMIAVRRGNYKLLINPDGTRGELYNIILDPSELQNLATIYPDVFEELKVEALNWYATIPTSPQTTNAGNNDWNWPKM